MQSHFLKYNFIYSAHLIIQISMMKMWLIFTLLLTNFTVCCFFFQIFHTIAIILLIISTLILLIGITAQLLSYDRLLKYELPFVVSMFVASVSNKWMNKRNISIHVNNKINLFHFHFISFTDSELPQCTFVLHIH